MTERVEHDRAIFAAMLGGPDGTTLFLLAAEWRGTEHLDEALAARTGQVLITKAPVPAAGWPLPRPVTQARDPVRRGFGEQPRSYRSCPKSFS